MARLILILGLIAATVFAWRAVKHRKRRERFEAAFPAEWEKILRNNVPIYSRMPEELRQELQKHINVFLGEKRFFGCAGLEITDEIRITIAAFACMLLLKRKANYYPDCLSILVYPSSYLSEERTQEGFVETLSKQHRLGESWLRGPVVLAWDSVAHGAFDIRDGHNVALHEFAHQLDAEDGVMDGAPVLEERAQYAAWAKVMRKEFKLLQEKAERGQKSVIDFYGAESPEEFFSVVVEAFFEKSEQLSRKHPELYAQLKAFFKLDPATWS